METPKKILSRTGIYGLALQNQKILLIKQKRGPFCGKLDLPGGKIESGESLEKALRREFLEEVGLSFEKMEFFENLTATTASVKDEKPYIFHQIGLIYRVYNLTPISDQNPEMEPLWTELKELPKKSLSPLLEKVIQHLN